MVTRMTSSTATTFVDSRVSRTNDCAALARVSPALECRYVGDSHSYRAIF